MTRWQCSSEIEDVANDSSRVGLGRQAGFYLGLPGSSSHGRAFAV